MKLYSYINFFERFGLRDFTVLSLAKSNEIIQAIRSNFTNCRKEKEILTSSPLFIESDLIRKMYIKALRNARNYIYTPGQETFGVAIANARECFTKSLTIAKESVRKSCIIAATDFSYYLRINYNDNSHLLHPDTFQIEMNYRDVQLQAE